MFRKICAGLLVAATVLMPAAALADDHKHKGDLVEMKMTGGEVSLIPHLALSLGYFKDEGLDVDLVDAGEFIQPHYKMQEILNNGKVDVSVHWFQHVFYGAANDQPVKAVMILNDAPGATVMVANRVKDQIRGAADFKDRRIAEGAGYATKSILTNLLARRAGLPAGAYTPVMIEVDGRQAAVTKGLANGEVDVMTFLEPMTAALKATGQVSVLYDLTSREATTKVLGAPWPAQSVFFAPSYIEKHPDRVQHVVNALVRTMTFVNSHSAEEIAEKLPESYFKGKNRTVELAKIHDTKTTYAKGDYSISPAMVKLTGESIRSAPFDASEEGKFRARARDAKINDADLYTNQFVNKAAKPRKGKAGADR